MQTISSLATIALLATACSSGGASSSSDQAQNDTATKNLADNHCRVVLRYAGLSGINGGEVFQDPATHTSWVRYRAVADVDSSLITAGAVVSLRYRAVFSGAAVGGTFPGRWIDVKAINPTDNPDDPALRDPGVGLSGGKIVPEGFTRVAFETTTDTMEAGDDVQPTIQMIPFLHQANGTNFWDHNRNPDPNGSYNLDNAHDFVVTDDFNACPAPSPAASDDGNSTG
jgi:hypothetical protein